MFPQRSTITFPNVQTEAERLAAALALPERPVELLELEAALPGLRDEVRRAEEHAQQVNLAHGCLNFPKPDGSTIRQVTTADIVEAINHARALRARLMADEKHVTELRRAFEESASAHIEPGVAQIIDRLLDHLDEFDALLNVLARTRAESAALRITMRNRAISDVSSLVSRIRELRARLGGAR